MAAEARESAHGPDPALAIPEMSLVVLVGASGSGKSTFAGRHFGEYEVLSSDTFRGMVSNDETNQAATAAAFAALQFVAGKRLEAGHLTVIDATSVQPSARRALVELARSHDVLPVAIVFDLPESLCIARNAERTANGSSRGVAPGVVTRQSDQLRRSLRNLGREGFRRVHILRNQEQVDTATITREPLLNDRSWDRGPFDVIGDVHGCRSELETLLTELGYSLARDDADRAIDASHPEGRRVIFLGDLVDRGPDSPGVLRLAMGMVGAGHALAVPGNHEAKLVRALKGAKVTTGHGLAETLAQLSGETADFREQVRSFCEGLISHLVLDGGDLVVAHAGLKEQYHGRASGRVREYALYGDVSGQSDEHGLPIRLPWANDYRGSAAVLYGHTPVPEVVWTNNTACLDTGCVFGGALSAMRYPEREIVQVAAEQQWAEPIRPLTAIAPEREPGILRLEDVQGRLRVETSTHGRIGIDERQSAGGLETMSRWATDPRWLLYLPPTMSPPKTSAVPGYLEHPAEAFEYFVKEGITDVICEEKHMGSRATALLARDPSRFDAPEGWLGSIQTRTGRPFFEPSEESAMLARMHTAMDAAGIWAELDADWALLDGEMLPWSLKAGDLIRDLYASVSASGLAATTATSRALAAAHASGRDVRAIADRVRARHSDLEQFRDAYRRYVGQPSEVRFAPFQVLAAGSRTFERSDHGWHLGIADRLVAEAPDLYQHTGRLRVNLSDPTSAEQAVQWWLELTENGGEGMVVKPFANLTRTSKGLVQPGIKVRGREYLRIIYGPSYTDERDLARLKERNTGQKRSLAGREYALGIESLHRVTRGEPVWKVHEAVFAILALESDPIDPRL